MAQPKEDVYCTLVLTDSYLPGAAVLAHSLRDNGTTKKLVALITQDSLKPETILQLKSLYDHVIPVPRISTSSLSNLAQLGRLDLRDACTKITLWNQTQFRKIVYIDADVVALRAPDELFDLPASFAAAPDIGWPDCFNTGVMLLEPNEAEYNALQSLAAGGNSFDGADQGLLNEYYENKPWHRLSFTYNCTPSASYQYEPAYRHFKNNIKMVHFIGKEKPWTKGRHALHSERSGVYKELLSRWWAVFDRHFTAKQQFPSQQHDLAVRIIKQYVIGEQSSGFEWASTGQAAPETSAEAAQKHVRFAEESRSEPSPEPERATSPPQQRWDATREAPPSKSEAEAHDFPSIHYSMSHSQDLFHAPKEYPEPPKNMWYEVPETKPKPRVKPKPIFPWESHANKPTRVFADEEPEYEPEVAEGFMLKTSLSPQSPISPTPVTPTIKVTHSDPWTSFSSKNAWDDDASIDRYVQSLKQSQFRGSVQVLHDSNPSSPRFTSPPSQSTRTTPAPDRKAYKISDMTSSMDLPSMPVTPAVSYRKQVFWGSDASSTSGSGNKGKDDILPAAQGVPEQSEWVCQNCGVATPMRDVLRQLSARTAAVARGSAGSPKPLPPRMKPLLPMPTVTPGAPPPTSFFSSSTAHASTVPSGASLLPTSTSMSTPLSSTSRRQPHVSQLPSQPPTAPPNPPRPSSSSPTPAPASRRANPNTHPRDHTNSANALIFTKNPLERLEELRRTSITDLPAPGKAAEMPQREMPKSAAPLPTEVVGEESAGGGRGVSWQPPAPMGGPAGGAASGASGARGVGERRTVSGPERGSQQRQRVPSEYDLA